MKRYHPDAELAPRDVVARAIDSEMKRHGLDFVYLDLSHRGADFIQRRFPNIFKRCLSFGYDLTSATDSGGARGALYVRRRADRSRCAHLDSRACTRPARSR